MIKPFLKTYQKTIYGIGIILLYWQKNPFSPITYKLENTKGLNSFVYVLILVINHVIKISINHPIYFN